jgi:hypothetical protein
MQTKWDSAGSTDMWSTSAGGHLMKVVNLTGFTVLSFMKTCRGVEVVSCGQKDGRADMTKPLVTCGNFVNAL